MTASTRPLADTATPDVMRLPEELWIAIVDIDDIHVYKVLFCLSTWHHKVINREWMARIKSQLTESPQLEPYESARSYYYRMMHHYQYLYSPYINKINRAASLGLEKIVNSLMTPEYITKDNLLNLSRNLNYTNPTLTLLLLSYIEKLPAIDQQPIILSACDAIVNNTDVHADKSVSLELLWKKMSPKLRDEFFVFKKIDERLLDSNRTDTFYGIRELTRHGFGYSFYIEWKITRLCLAAANPQVVLSHFPEEQRDDLLESAIYFNLIFRSKLQAFKCSSELYSTYARLHSALIACLSLPRKAKLLTDLQVMLNTLYAADLKSIFEMDLVPNFFRVKAYVYSADILDKHNRFLKYQKRQMWLAGNGFKYVGEAVLDKSNYFEDSTVKEAILADGLYINFLIDPVDAMTNSESLFVTSNKEISADRRILCQTLKMYVGESVDFALLQAFIDKLSREDVVHVIVELLLNLSLTYSQLEALFEHCKALSILDRVLAGCVSSYYSNQVFIYHRFRGTYYYNYNNELGDKFEAEEKYSRIQRYFPNINWQKLTSNYFSNEIQNSNIFSARVKGTDLCYDQVIISYLVGHANLESGRLVAERLHLFLPSASFAHSVEKHVMHSLLSDKNEPLGLFLVALSVKHVARLLVKLSLYDDANNTALAAKLLRNSPQTSSKIAELLMSCEENLLPHIVRSLPSLTVKVLLKNFLEKVFLNKIDYSFMNDTFPSELLCQMLLRTEKVRINAGFIVELCRYVPQEEASFMLFSVLSQYASNLLSINDFLADSRRLGNKAFLTIFFAAFFYDFVGKQAVFYDLVGKQYDLYQLFKKVNETEVDLSVVIIQAFKFAIRLSDDNMFNALKRKLIELELMKPNDLRIYANGLMGELSGDEKKFLRRMTSDHFLVAPPSSLQLIAHPSFSRPQSMAVSLNTRRMGH